MTTMTSHSLANAVQSLIDARLETIERMLMGRVPRSDRLAIVQEVESQIYESLGDRDPQSISSDDMLEILRQLDPPEAYLANEIQVSEPAREFRAVYKPNPIAGKPVSGVGSEARIGGITGLCSLGLILMAPIPYLVASTFNSEILLLFGLGGFALLGIAASIVALILSIRCRRQGLMPILGLVAASLSLPIWLLGCSFMLLSMA